MNLGQVSVDAEIIKTTDDAVLIDHDGEEIWVPRKCCINGSRLDVGDRRLLVANWWWEGNVE